MEPLVAVTAAWALLGVGCVADTCQPVLFPADLAGAGLPTAGAVLGEVGDLVGLSARTPPFIEAELPGPHVDLARFPRTPAPMPDAASPASAPMAPRIAELVETSTHDARAGGAEAHEMGHAAAPAGPQEEGRALATSPAGRAAGTFAAAFAMALFHHLSKERVLRHVARREIVAMLRIEPGLGTSEIARRLACSYRTARHHLDTLALHDLVRGVDEGNGRLAWLPPGRTTEPGQLTAAQERALAVIRTDPGLHLSKLARDLGLAKATAKFHVDSLAERGLVVEQRLGTLRCFYPIELAPEA